MYKIQIKMQLSLASFTFNLGSLMTTSKEATMLDRLNLDWDRMGNLFPLLITLPNKTLLIWPILNYLSVSQAGRTLLFFPGQDNTLHLNLKKYCFFGGKNKVHTLIHSFFLFHHTSRQNFISHFVLFMCIASFTY